MPASPTFLALGISFMEDNYSMDWRSVFTRNLDPGHAQMEVSLAYPPFVWHGSYEAMDQY